MSDVHPLNLRIEVIRQRLLVDLITISEQILFRILSRLVHPAHFVKVLEVLADLRALEVVDYLDDLLAIDLAHLVPLQVVSRGIELVFGGVPGLGFSSLVLL